jgi:hypothetical protein
MSIGSSTVSAHTEAITAVAIALERLVARITRDLDVDAGEGVPPGDPEWATTIAGVVSYARECAAVLDEPVVFKTLTCE